MEVLWEVDDNSGSPHKTMVDDSILAECKTEEERQSYICDCIEKDFLQRVGWFRVE